MRTLLIVLGLVSATSAADPIREAPKPLAVGAGGIGRYMPDATFTDLAGKAGKLSDFAKSKYLVIATTNTTCPLSKKFAPTLAKLEAEYTKKEVAFLFVNPTKTDTPKHNFASRYVHDEQFAATLGLKTTTEVIVLDAARTVVYRGAVDDQYGLGYSLDAPKHTYLKDALDFLLVAKTAEVQATTAPGCNLDFPKPASFATTYHNRISRIVQQHCQECHRKDGVGPFSLERYEDVVSHKGIIRRVVVRGVMPPWSAAPPKAGEVSHFVNDRSLSASDKAELLAWLAGEMPLGKEADAPLKKSWPTDWQIGKPDAVFQIPKPIDIKADGIMPYQTVHVETSFSEDKWVEAFEVRPTAKQVVHHVLVHLIPAKGGLGRFFPGARTQLDGNVDDERSGYFAAYVPGSSHVSLPPGYARKLPKGATLRFQIHYTPNGEATKDQTQVAFRFAKEPPKHVVKVGAVMQPGIRIPPGADNHREVGKQNLPTDVILRSFAPHMHVRGKACRYELTTPDGKTTTLLDIPRYDFNWQLRYLLAEPVRVPKGSTITFTVWFDNSEKNPANPDPKKLVRWGPQTYDEMHLGYIEYEVASETEEPFSQTTFEKPMIPKEGYPIPEKFKAGLGSYDTNKDGRLDEKEIDAMPMALKARVYDYILKMK